MINISATSNLLFQLLFTQILSFIVYSEKEQFFWIRSVKPKGRGAEQKIGGTLTKLTEEDRTLSKKSYQNGGCLKQLGYVRVVG